MSTPEATLVREITETAEYIAANAERIPRHWRRQVLLALERAERFVAPPSKDELSLPSVEKISPDANGPADA